MLGASAIVVAAGSSHDLLAESVGSPTSHSVFVLTSTHALIVLAATSVFVKVKVAWPAAPVVRV